MRPFFSPSPLGLQDVHIWAVDLDRLASTFPHLDRVLSEDERARAERFHNSLHGQRFATARGMLRSLLEAYLNFKAVDIQFHYTDRGKPYLAHPLAHSSEQNSAQDLDQQNGKFSFNVSHSGDTALFAFTRCKAIGVDVERWRTVDRVEQLTNRFFRVAEHQTILAIPPVERSTMFLRYWVCKEAYLKSTGEGLAALEQVEIKLSQSPMVTAPTSAAQLLVSNLTTAVPWSLHEVFISPDCAAAVAVSCDTPMISFNRDWLKVP